MSETLLAALRQPACYPHAIADPQLIETHISWVLLTGDYAYKIKKPVNPGFLDFRSLEQRRHFCQEELRLNARFGHGIYLDVVPITGSPAAPWLGEPRGEPFEYALKMRQFPQEALLERQAGAGLLSADDMERLGTLLARFHEEQAERLPSLDAPWGSPALVEQALRGNFDLLATLPCTAAERRSLQRLEARALADLARLRPLLEQRRRQGFVRECHGDLHLGNVARGGDDFLFFDCLEFNPAFRWVDIVSELAFLMMDLETRGLAGHANRLLNAWLEVTGDVEGLALLDFYRGYRALVRAKVSLLRVSDGGLPAAEAEGLRRAYRGYLALARRYTRPRRRFLALMHGLSGSGKSTVAAALAEHCQALRLRSDVERKRLFGLAPGARSTGELRERLYSREASRLTFDALAQRSRRALGAGWPVFVDATFLARHWRDLFRALADELGVPLLIVDCHASDATLRARLLARQAAGSDPSEADVAVMESQRAHAEPFSAGEEPWVLTVDTEAPLRPQALIEALRARCHPPETIGVAATGLLKDPH